MNLFLCCYVKIIMKVFLKVEILYFGDLFIFDIIISKVIFIFEFKIGVEFKD